jgi:hypothetical protein
MIPKWQSHTLKKGITNVGIKVEDSYLKSEEVSR